MTRTLSYRAREDGRLLLEEPTIVFHLTSRCERPSEELGILAGEHVRVELRDAGGHLLDSLTYAASLP